MGSFSIWHWLIVLAVVLILFGGGGKISKIMGDMASGVKAFKKGIKEEDPSEVEAAKTISAQSAAATASGPARAPDSVMHKDETAKG
jgi:sec-independent protein translocase protein TatA